MAFPTPLWVKDLGQAIEQHSEWDGIIVIAPETTDYRHSKLAQIIEAHKELDARTGVEPVLITHPDIAGQRLIFAPTGNLLRDYDDVRRFADAGKKAITIARDAGMLNPLLVVDKLQHNPLYEHALEVTYLAMCQALWQPLEARESIGENKVEPVESIGLFAVKKINLDWLVATETGRRLARDLCGTEPERMAPPKFADYCVEAFTDSPVKVEVLCDKDSLLDHYPLLSAVARASIGVESHHPRVIRLEYCGEGPIENTLMLAGKGVTYDTGGADIKTGGHMAGMSRDKGGAAAVAGFIKTASLLKPKGLKIVAELGVVRNSIGSQAFVADEIIQSHAGVRVRIGNTDAEGRLVMADLLSHLREQAVNENQVELFTVATLTGHAALAMGPYTALVDNGVARAHGCSTRLAAIGDVWGDPSEISRSRREDFHFIRPRSLADDVLSSNNAPSSGTARGHQFPMAFLTVASGLDQHCINSQYPLSYTHIDIAGSGVESGDWQHDMPTGVPVVALSARYLR
ncbi:M17 family metallopeptidase [Neptunicella sp. SCSIO 80796]|uniref:M17 family metallopeptidase n=1 Tax=Neptunicella plasticusilytica TaxID=3117012 RepID=UPI003A4D56DB